MPTMLCACTCISNKSVLQVCMRSIDTVANLVPHADKVSCHWQVVQRCQAEVKGGRERKQLPRRH